MNPYRKETGNTLVLILAIFIVGVLIFTFVALNYNQLFTHQKQAQTAIDAAALAVASEIGKVTYNSPNFGRVGIVDEYPSVGLSAQPIFGINTVMGRTRLDRAIANRLGNTSMYFMAKADEDETARCTRELSNILTAANESGDLTYTDKNGTSPPTTAKLKEIAARAFNESGLRVASASTQPVTPGDVTVELGTITGNAGRNVTNVPVPSSEAEAHEYSAKYKDPNGNDRIFYRANTPAPIEGSGFQYMFSIIGDGPTITNRADFQASTQVGASATTPVVVPTVVRVTIREQVRAFASGKEKGAEGGAITSEKIEIACAAAGGRRVTPTAGIFRLEFPQGIPQANNGGVSFDSPLALMNSSQLPPDADKDSAASPAAGWSGRGMHFTAVNGPFPGVGSVAPSDVYGRPRDNPSIAIAFYTWSWLRHQGLRPNVEAVFNALNRNIRTTDAGTDTVISDRGDFLMQSAQAVCDPARDCNVWGAIFALRRDSDWCMTRGNDMRSLANFDANTRQRYLQQAFNFRMQTSAPQQMAYANSFCMAYGLNNNGEISTTDCNPISDLLDFRQALADNVVTACATAQNAYQVAAEQQDAIDQILNRLAPITDRLATIDARLTVISNMTFRANDDSDDAEQARVLQERADLLGERADLVHRAGALDAEKGEPGRKNTRAIRAYANCATAIRLAVGIFRNMLVITSQGIDKVADGYYRAAGNTFLPLGRVGTADEIRAGSTSATTTYGADSQGNPRQTYTNTFTYDNPPVRTGQYEGPLPGDQTGGSRNYVATSIYTVNDLSTLTRPICTLTLTPTSQTKNLVLNIAGDNSHSTDGGNIIYKMEDTLPSHWIRLLPTENPVTTLLSRFGSATDPAQITGIANLLTGQLQFQALNVFGNPDPQDARLITVWSCMAQNNTHNPALADARDPEEAGNKPDCGRANTDEDDPTKRACDAESVRFQFTSPLLFTTIPIPPINLPPAPPGLEPIPGIPQPPGPPGETH